MAVGARGRLSNFIFRENTNIGDLLIRQYLSIRIGGLGLSKSILIAFGGGTGIHIASSSAENIRGRGDKS